MRNDLTSLIQQQALSGNNPMQHLLNNKWHGMSSAPRDGTRIIVYFAVTQKKYYAQYDVVAGMWFVEGGELKLSNLEPCAWRYDIEGPHGHVE